MLDDLALGLPTRRQRDTVAVDLDEPSRMQSRSLEAFLAEVIGARLHYAEVCVIDARALTFGCRLARLPLRRGQA